MTPQDDVHHDPSGSAGLASPELTDPLALLADIGGTRARFSLLLASPANPATQTGVGFTLAAHRELATADHHGLLDATRVYLSAIGLAAPPPHAAVAVACPVDGDWIALTNQHWAFSIESTRRALGFESLSVDNDFTALARSLPMLGPADLVVLHAGSGAKPTAGAAHDRPLALIGPGTGLGVGALIPAPDGSWVPLASEGGHRDLAPVSEREWRVLEVLANRFGRVSAERVVSGQGLINLWWALAALDALETDAAPVSPDLAANLQPADITARAAAGDRRCREVLNLFSGWLGAVAGDLVLTLGARGGLYLAGGILPRLGAAETSQNPSTAVFRRDLFLERFLAKGRFRSYLTAVPVHLVTHPNPALLGLASHILQR